MNELYEAIILTEEELIAAILEGKKKKFFHERSKEYWESQEIKKPQSTRNRGRKSVPVLQTLKDI